MTEPQIQEILNDITERIKDKFDPERIILYGSHARGTAGPDSDADLLVIINGPGSNRRKAVEIDLSLDGIPLPTDIIVVTPEDVEKYHDSPGTIIREALHEGRVLYERAV